MAVGDAHEFFFVGSRSPKCAFRVKETHAFSFLLCFNSF